MRTNHSTTLKGNLFPPKLTYDSQTITAADIVSRVSGLGSLSTLGIFLDGSTDIDNNQYRGEFGNGRTIKK